MVNLSLILNTFANVDHGLPTAHLHAAPKIETCRWKANAQFQRSLPAVRTKSQFLPPETGRLAVNRKSLAHLLGGWTAKIVEAEVVAGNSRQRLASRCQAVRLCLRPLTITIGFYRLPGWNP